MHSNDTIVRVVGDYEIFLLDDEKTEIGKTYRSATIQFTLFIYCYTIVCILNITSSSE